MMEDLIHKMLDEIGRCDIGDSQYSIIEKYFKQIREDTKKECIEVVEKYSGHADCNIDGSEPDNLAEKMKL